MIVSHARRFIFIKTSKTAGTSVEMQLSKFCGPDDIVTPGMESKDPKYAQYADSRRPRNLAMPLHRAAYVSLPIPPLIFAKKHIRPRRTFYDHMPAFRIRRALPGFIWKSYFKFTVVRNPYDRAVSQYFWNNRNDVAPTKDAINDYILTEIKPHLLTNWYMYALGDKVLVDDFVRYEDLEAGLRAAMDRLNIREPLTLPHAKGGHRPGGYHYREVVSPAARAYIEKQARRELDYFGYQW
jgi:hypothetical protein